MRRRAIASRRPEPISRRNRQCRRIGRRVGVPPRLSARSPAAATREQERPGRGARVEYVTFLRQDRPGAAVVEGLGDPIVLATAAAALKAIGGWDESVPILIECGGREIAVRLSFDGRTWHADAS
jgi:hypothetical protein